MTMETRCYQKRFEFQRYPPKDSCTARYEHKFWGGKNPNFQKNMKKSFLARFGPIHRPEKNLAKCYFEAARFRVLDVLDRHRSTKPTTAPLKSERGALVTGSDPPSGQSVHKTASDACRAPARRLIQTHLGTAV